MACYIGDAESWKCTLFMYNTVIHRSGSQYQSGLRYVGRFHPVIGHEDP